MRRFVCLLAGVLLVVPSLGSDSPEYDGATEMKGLEGEWRLTALTVGGHREDAPRKLMATFGRESFVRYYDSGGVIARGTYTADQSRTPAHLDETIMTGPQAGQVWMNLYRVDGDTLRIASNPGGTRPRDFGDSHVVETYRRVRK
jgi:uncharacterized protein (TIGR03067 family)